MFKFVCCALAAMVLAAGSASADSLSGTIRYKDGSKDRGVAAITTSWNSQRGKNDGSGNYRIDFKGKVGKRITVYVNGKTYAQVRVSGNTRLNIIIP